MTSSKRVAINSLAMRYVSEYAVCIIARIFVFHHHPNDEEVNWSIHTILDPSAMNPGAQ